MTTDPPDDEPADGDDEPVLLSDEPTVDLIVKAKAGDNEALEAVLQRSMPRLQRWAHGRLPPHARGVADTQDLVQEAAMKVLARLPQFQPTHVGAMQAYLRRIVINDIRSRLRTVKRWTVPEELSEDLAVGDMSPEEAAIESESVERYRAALARLRARDREIVVARIEGQWTLRELTKRFGFNTENAARMATTRAFRRLRTEMDALE